jgi:hypothetical protein
MLTAQTTLVLNAAKRPGLSLVDMCRYLVGDLSLLVRGPLVVPQHCSRRLLPDQVLKYLASGAKISTYCRSIAAGACCRSRY